MAAFTSNVGTWSISGCQLEGSGRRKELENAPLLHPLSPDSGGKKRVREIEEVSYGRRALMGGKALAQVSDGVDRPG